MIEHPGHVQDLLFLHVRDVLFDLFIFSEIYIKWYLMRYYIFNPTIVEDLAQLQLNIPWWLMK